MRQFWTRLCCRRLFLVVAAFSVVTLAASSPIYSAVTVRIVGHTSASQQAAVTTADCSTATATAIVLRLHLNDPEVADPVGKVLGRSFTGPGSQTMVVSLFGPGNTGLIDWAVFRWEGDAWQFLMKQPSAASISAAGSDIRQTLPVYRPDDRRCCPSGGTKTRIWHWNGTRFTVGPWKQVTRGKGEPSRFDSPSHNIHCFIFDGSGDYSRGVGCHSDTPRRIVNMAANGQLKVRGTPKAWCGCDDPDFPPLGYGKQITVGRFRCVSQRSGMRCVVVQSGKGFLISRSGVHRVGR